MDEEKKKRMYERQALRKKEYAARSIQRRKERDPQYRINEFLSEVRFTNKSGSHVNCFRYFPNNTDEHEDMKYKVFKQLRKMGHDVLVEAIFNNNKRADILDLTEGVVYEITYSETEKELTEKVQSYPASFEIRHIDAKKEFREELLL